MGEHRRACRLLWFCGSLYIDARSRSNRSGGDEAGARLLDRQMRMLYTARRLAPEKPIVTCRRMPSQPTRHLLISGRIVCPG